MARDLTRKATMRIKHQTKERIWNFLVKDDLARIEKREDGSLSLRLLGGKYGDIRYEVILDQNDIEHLKKFI